MSGTKQTISTIPDVLRQLLRMTIRGFYPTEHYVSIEALLSHPYIKEQELANLLQFEPKMLRSVLNVLKSDKFVKMKLVMDIDAEGRPVKHNCYYIDYNVFINVLKYKLDHIRRKIETEERNATSRSSFECVPCQIKFTDLQTKDLFDPMSGLLLCTYCMKEVTEDTSSANQQTARELLVRFNEQMSPLFNLLRECEDLDFTLDGLPPDVNPLTAMRENIQSGQSQTNRPANSTADNHAWSGDATRSKTFGATASEVTITMDEDAVAIAPVVQKEIPSWISASTVNAASHIEDHSLGQTESFDITPNKPLANEGLSASDDVLHALLAHETSEKMAGAASSSVDDFGKLKTDLSSPTAHSQSEDNLIVTVGNRKISMDEVNDEILAQMTEPEREEYEAQAQRLYAHLFD